MKYFIFILLIDLFDESSFLPWYIHAIILAIVSLEFITKKFGA